MKQMEQKSRKRSLREKSVRWLAGFFLVMLLLTLLSRAADAVTVPVVQTGYLKKSTIDRTVTAEGRIVQNQERAVSTVAGLRVGSVPVREGQPVAAGDVLFELDAEDLSEKIRQAEQEYRKLELALKDLESGKDLTEQERNKAKQRADEDYANTSVRTGREVEDAERAMTKAKEDLENFLAGDSDAPAEDPVLTGLENTCQEKQDALDQAMQEQQNLEQEIQAAVAADPPQEAEIRRSYEAKLAEAAERIKTCEQEKEQADNALEAYLAQKDAKNEEDRGAMEESLRAAYEEKKKAYETALQNRKDSLENASRNVEDANAPTKEDSSGETARMDLENKKRELDQLKALEEQAGKIVSPADGLISKVNVTTGDFTGEGTAVLMADLTEGGRFQAAISKAQEKYLSRGDTVSLKQNGAEALELPIDTIQQDTENPNSYVVTVQVPAGTLEIGTVAVMTAVRQSETYTACVPLSAIHREDGQDYVLAIQETKTVLGTELTAERIPVTILDKNESLAALSPGALTEDQKLITGSNKEVNGGDRVRLEDT